MSASLVGSEMCIRDRLSHWTASEYRRPAVSAVQLGQRSGAKHLGRGRRSSDFSNAAASREPAGCAADC
eukprot:9628573-Alexandrium_andersonii.AAC.1